MHIRVPTPGDHAAQSTPSGRADRPAVSLIVIDDAAPEALRETLASTLTLEADPALDIVVVQTRRESADVLRDFLRLTDAPRVLQRHGADRAEAFRDAARAAVGETLLVVDPGLRLRPSLVAACLDTLARPAVEVHVRVDPLNEATGRPGLEAFDRDTLERIGAVVVDPSPCGPWRIPAERPDTTAPPRRTTGGRAMGRVATVTRAVLRACGLLVRRERALMVHRP